MDIKKYKTKIAVTKDINLGPIQVRDVGFHDWILDDEEYLILSDIVDVEFKLKDKTEEEKTKKLKAIEERINEYEGKIFALAKQKQDLLSIEYNKD